MICGGTHCINTCLFVNVQFEVKPDDGHCLPKHVVFIYNKTSFIRHILVVLLTVVTPPNILLLSWLGDRFFALSVTVDAIQIPYF